MIAGCCNLRAQAFLCSLEESSHTKSNPLSGFRLQKAEQSHLASLILFLKVIISLADSLQHFNKC